MAQFTKELRQEIVREFALRHNGIFNPALFLDEVRSAGPSHQAYEWFEWDASKAALAYQTEQARNFARDLRVVFKIEEIGRKSAFTVRQTEMPMVMSPMAGRSKGGGYILVDPDDAEHMQEHCRQAATALRAWLDRYDAALVHCGGKRGDAESIIARLDRVSALPALAAE